MRYNPEHKENTRRKVLSEAASAIRLHGPDGIGVADLMAKAGLTHGGFYAHFSSKDDLVAQSISQMFDERHEHFRRCIEGREPAEGFARFVDSYLSTKHRDAMAVGCPLPSLSGDVARQPLEARQRFGHGVERLAHEMAELLQKMGKPEPKRLAASILAELVGALSLSRAVAEPKFSEQVLKSSREAIRRRIEG